MTNQMATTMLYPAVWPDMETKVFCHPGSVVPRLRETVRESFFAARRQLQRIRNSIAEVPGTAYFIEESISGSGARQQLYRLSDPLDETAEYVVVSAVQAMWSGPETYIFKANPDGDVVGWSELTGSFQGDLDHQRALREAGYRVVRHDEF
ncbi:hypothetical protein LCGC14_0916520 [marine sediment metagenome]|uniref:Uncharacterized protein n=1 Tax=marine sediment metagenome TaxID=412755 RepID=A0A0F9PCX5_9ZZZZ